MKTRILVFCIVLALLLGVGVSPSFASIDPNSFSLVITLYGASSSSCGSGGHIGFSTSVTFSGGTHTQFAKVTDGAGNVLFAQAGPTFPDGTYSSYGSFTYAVAPVKNPITAKVVYDGVTYTGSVDNPCLPSSGVVFTGPPIPGGFVLRTIICDVAVYDTPGGSPVGANMIKNGQTWYVSSTPVQGADGQSWTEIFVSGVPNGFVPTRCVGG